MTCMTNVINQSYKIEEGGILDWGRADFSTF